MIERFRRAALLSCLAALCLGFFYSASIAETILPGPENSFEMDSRDVYIPSRSLADQPGKISIVESYSEFSHEFKIFDKLPLTLSLENEYIGIGNSGSALKFPAHLTGLGMGVETVMPFFNVNNTYFRLKVIPSFYTDNWSFYSSAFRVATESCFIYKASDKLILMLGVAVYPNYESPVWPIVGLIYNPNDKLSFDLNSDEPNISYKINKILTLFVGGGFNYDEFDVRKNGSKGIILRDQEAYAGGGIKIKLAKFIEASVSGGSIINQYLKYKDGAGKVDIKNGPYVAVKVQIDL